jgi:ElaB/YqjD/DUF883 family membrane-anchored ribosome-binding protein
VATETDAGRERVIAARAELATELDRLEASARAAVDIKAKIRRSPGKAIAIAGGTGFVLLGGPKRVFRRVKGAIVGPDAPLPEQMLPDEIEKVLRKLGDDGDRVRGTLERDFADYVKAAQKRRGPAIRQTLYYALTGPILRRGTQAAADWLLRPDEQGFLAQLERLRAREAPPAGAPAEGETAADETGVNPR